MKRLANTLLVFVLLLSLPAIAAAGPISWTDWTSASQASATGTATGTMGGVTVSYSGDLAFAQINGGTNYWAPDTAYLSPTVSNAPPASDILAISHSNNLAINTITFSEQVYRPVMALVSLGQPWNYPGTSQPYYVYYNFRQPFDVVSDGIGYWDRTGIGFLKELDGNVLQGYEGHGVIQFDGWVSSISWSTNPDEYWHGFTVGTPVPEPASMLLLGTGLVGLARVARRRRK